MESTDAKRTVARFLHDGRSRWAAAVTGVVILGGAVVASGFGGHRTGAGRYAVAPVERGPLVATVSASGTLNAVTTVQVGSQVSGQIKALAADFNTTVTRGQLVAQIDPETFQAQLQQAQADRASAAAAVLTQQGQIAKQRADLENARAAQAQAHAQTAKAEITVADAKRNLDRMKTLKQQELVAQADQDTAQTNHDAAVAQLDATRAQERAAIEGVTSAEAQLRVAQAQLQAGQATVALKEAAERQAQINLDHTRIVAPVDGVVVARNVDVGQTVAASLQAPTLFLIAQDLTKMQVDTSVDEADVGRVHVGEPARFTVDAYPGRTFQGAVREVRKAPQVAQNVVTYDVVVSAANPDQALLPGMTANVSVTVANRDDVVKVPNAALRFRPSSAPPAPAGARDAASGDQVWTAGPDGSPRPIAVTAGLTDGRFTEVTGGALRPGESVIVGTVGAPAKAATRGSAAGPRGLGL